MQCPETPVEFSWVFPSDLPLSFPLFVGTTQYLSQVWGCPNTLGGVLLCRPCFITQEWGLKWDLLTVWGVFSPFQFLPDMALFSSIFCINDERATAHLNWAQPIWPWTSFFSLLKVLLRAIPSLFWPGWEALLFPVLFLSMQIIRMSILSWVMGANWFRLYSAVTWSSDRHCTDQLVHSDHAVTTGWCSSFFWSLTCSNPLLGQLTHLMAFGFRTTSISPCLPYKWGWVLVISTLVS